MKRSSWSALAPCPIAKELIPIHPRKVYYYLTTMPRQPLPENSDEIVIPSGKQMTPSVTSVDQDDEDVFARQRSPSPEVDLSSPDFEDEHMHLNGRPDGAARSGSDFHTHMRLMHSNRAASPPLEGDEKEFTQTASAVRERASEHKASQQGQTGAPRSGISEGLSQMGMNFSTLSSFDDDSPSSSFNGDRMSDEFEYADYFSHPGALDHKSPAPQQQQGQDDDAAACALFGTSPSPSLTSVASSLPSSASSDAGLDTPDNRPQIALPVDPEIAHVSPLKRSIDMLNSGFPAVDIKMSDLAESEDKVAIKTRPSSNMDVDMAFDSWRELQSPETVEVDELDEMFGEI